MAKLLRAGELTAVWVPGEGHELTLFGAVLLLTAMTIGTIGILVVFIRPHGLARAGAPGQRELLLKSTFKLDSQQSAIGLYYET